MHMSLKLAGALAAFIAGVAAADPPDDTDAAPEASADIYVYPSKGQTEKQLDRDRYECHNWAVAQSHYNPSDPHLAPHQQIQVVEMAPPGRDTAVGAVTGAVIGSSVAGRHDSGGGAVAGAIVGAMIGASSDAARQRQTTQVSTRVSAEAQTERARLERQASDYRRAISACLEGRGYTVR
jgi:uncharacterized protein YcfJ